MKSACAYALSFCISVQEREAQLEAEQQDKRSLQQQLEDAHAEAQQLRQQAEAQRAELLGNLAQQEQQLADAALAAQVLRWLYFWPFSICVRCMDEAGGQGMHCDCGD